MSLQRVRGTEDLKAEIQFKHNFIIQTAKKISQQYCFQELSTPILEHTEIFNRTLGLDSNIVNKEMFTFTRNKTSLCLRPEGTAGIARHFITEKLQHQLPLRFFYQGPMFRYERPQKGRLRQFHAVGVELLGEASARGDIECISLAWLLLQKLHIQSTLVLEINSIGDKESRTKYKKSLIDYLKPLQKQLSEDSRKRLINNPLRILDSKEKQDIEIIKLGPSIQDFLNSKSTKFFNQVLNGLKLFNIPYTINPLLVRGLDYYSHCVFEFKSISSNMGSQNTLIAGGRYDQLIDIMTKGKSQVSGVGWSAGIERLCFLIPQNTSAIRPIALIVLGVDKNVDEKNETEDLALKLAWELRQAGLTVFHPKSTGNLNKQMKRALQVKSKYALIFGPIEIKKNILSIKDLDQKKQISIKINESIDYLKKAINGII